MFRATPESPRLFGSDWIDVFTRVPWYAVPLVYAPFLAGLLAVARLGYGTSMAALAGQFLAGWFAWTLMEYWLHRTLFHWVPPTSWGPRFHFLLHGVHHEWFRDRLRLVMPPAVSLAIAAVVWSALWATQHALAPLLAPVWAAGFFAGIVFGYVVYDLTHYHLHHGRPRTRVGLLLRAHHNKHHHNPAHQDRKFGVSTTLWDHVFRTY